ncbi:hypothetical protein OTSGILL_1772 [Orientia tsutsugamushi str. Gilliam]|uniref:Uncharacterized protein n=2 Tax=Orientia tsutsugamushi TaxID=784 RepID=A0A0F3M8M0_ORITS|nr:hypothetical protein [Orientia tsutsugamushi]KJV52093.1 hypothetical protein OTSGILL_1772 [Orientia tsutsugamushi str. Gilliam]KJV55962.1 hypothetical protein OTSKARP_0611 [Orientia tsutsugamushi str. Karp]SPR09764.1 Uncharacterised protein [Orientia tsutsugamushi str. Gilliam]SPR15399.1 Uncharacterised protein [Orientia tsutsugamushi]
MRKYKDLKNKKGKVNMISLVEIFWITDNFCKYFEEGIKKYVISNPPTNIKGVVI